MSTRGFTYQVKESTIFVRNRPKNLSHNEDGYTDAEKADAYLSVTDTFVVAPINKIFVWFPWNEGRDPIPEMYYATNKVLNWWINYQKLKSIQIFCDGGTHRSVTVFGAFLLTYFTRKEAEEIIAARQPVNQQEDKNYQAHCQPLEYVDSYLNKFPEDLLLFKAMNQDRLGRLDSHSHGIYDLVKARYGDNK